ncbi:hypothetical protein DRN75_00955 [Nanoarchaeota archaeon]|nr:MAG: hypothetical protein DRN75_00955 [Nanoarchaeota archaeon]
MNLALQAPFKLFKEQREDLVVLANNSHWANFSEMGAGKTLPSALLSKGVIEDGHCDYAIIVTPKIVVSDWYEVFTDMIVCDAKELVRVYRAPRRVRKFMSLKPIIIVTYETIADDIDRFYKLALDHKVMITIDEAHYLKNHSSQRTKKLTKLSRLCTRVYLLTGSPITNGLKNAYSYINILRPGKYYNSFDHFKRAHMRFKKRMLIMYIGTQKVSDILDGFSMRHMKRDMHDLPEVTFKVRKIEWDPTQLKLYKIFLRDSILELDTKFIEGMNAGALLVRAHQIITNPMQLDLPCDSLKFKQISLDMEGISGKVVIYAHYRHTIKRLKEQLKEYNPAVIFGGISDVDAQKEKFKHDDSCRLMIAHPQSAGVGTNFSVSSHVFFFEYSYDLDSFDQAISRLDRPGQKNPVTVIAYAVRGSVEINKMLPKLVEKKDFSVNLLKDKKELVRFLEVTDIKE